jgi:hypothetical protein
MISKVKFVIKYLLAVPLFLVVVSTLHAQVKITIDHNTGAAATSAFRFKNVPPPLRDDQGPRAQVQLVDGRIDPSGADLNALTDGLLPTDEDDPGANFFFNAGSFGGRFRMDFGRAVEISQVNSYSWHSSDRAPQLYKLYGSDGASAKFCPAPKRGVDPAGCGWTFIATVSSIPLRGEDGGQYGVSIADPRGTLGTYRYLLFDIYPTEIVDNWGNTFFSEIDVVARK